MNAFSLTDVAHSSPNGPLFEGVTLGIDDGEKIGLIGRNGSGKSTFLRLLTGEVEPESGTVVSARGVRVSVLPQNPRVVPGLTIGRYLAADLPAGHRVANVSPEAEHDSAHHADALVSYAAICDQLGLTDPTLALETLSGGMLKKAALARCLAHESEFLILDEPTNHLDIDTISWLESRLRERTGGFVLVTHDRYILDAVCDTILEIDREGIYRYPGSYSVYLERREERRNALEAAETRRNTILKAELAWLQRGARARTGKDKRRTERVAALLDDGLVADPTVSEMPAVKRRQGKKVLELRDIAKSYDGVRVFEGLSYKFRAGEKIGVIGPNGSGKSTLLDVVSGRTAQDTGEIERGETTVIGYFDQTGERIETSLTVLEYMKQHAERVRINAETTLTAESFLERFLFPRSMFAQPLEKLSGGEFRRLRLVRLLATAPNFLLLDEPTNDLDLDTLRVFEQYLEQFAGCALIVSHDRALLDRVTESLFVFTADGKIVPFVGDYDAYRAQLGESESTSKRAATRLANEARTASEANRTRRTARTGLSFREQREYEKLPDELEVIENELKGLESFFADAALDPGTLAEKTRRYHELRDTVEKKTKRWEELAERADG